MRRTVFVKPVQNDIRRQGTGRIRCRKYIGSVLRHEREDGVQVFIGHDTVHDDERRIEAAVDHVLQLLEIVLQRMGVVADVRNDVRLRGEAFPSTMKMHVAGRMEDAVRDSGVVAKKLKGVLLPKDVDGGKDRPQVLLLHLRLQVHLPEHLRMTGPEGRFDLIRVGERAEHPGFLVEYE